MKTYIKILLIIIILASSCAKEGPEEVDTIPPTKPHLIPHLGDPGDDTVSVFLTDENNGIDAMPGENWIRIMWNYLPDDDLHHIFVKRHNNEDTTTTIADTIYTDVYDTSFVDKFLERDYDSATPKMWYYYIEVVDEAGNSTISDTVNYKLLECLLLSEPAPGDTFITTDPTDSLVFRWMDIDAPYDIRVLLFDESGNMQWYKDSPSLIGSGDCIFDGSLMPGKYFWRVDAFDVEKPSGSESEEREIIFQFK